MLVNTPSGELQVSPAEWLDVRAGWEADIVSGASVAVKAGSAYQATHPSADVVSTASVHDFRNLGHGGFTLRRDAVTITGNYAYSTENDYRSNSFNVTARTELFQNNTQFELAYARNFDSVCDRTQAANATATRYVALEDSTHCFAKDDTSFNRTTHDIDIDSFQGSWTQSWTPVFATQLAYTAELLSGFQSSPYRSVIVGEGLKAQEHVPENRARESVSLRMNWFLRPIKTALRIGVRGYWDTWDIKSIAADAELERSIFTDGLKLMIRGRYYQQSGALFWSDDYTGGNPPLGPKGQYWTGSRELSPFSSVQGGGRLSYTAVAKNGRILGALQWKLALTADAVAFHYDEYTLGGSPITGAIALLGTLQLAALF